MVHSNFFYLTGLWAFMESKSLSPRRKVAYAGFREPDRFGKAHTSVRAEKFLDVKDELNRTNPDIDITVEHFFIKALSLSMKDLRYANGRLRMGRFYEFDTVDISAIVSRDDGHDISMVKGKDVPNQTIPELARSLKDKASKARSGDKGEEERNTVLDYMPVWLLGFIMTVLFYLNETWGFSVPPFLKTPYMSGAALVSNIGAYDTKNLRAYAHPSSRLQCPMFIALHRIEKEPVVRDDELVIEKRLPFVLTVNHRFIDFHEGIAFRDRLRRALEKHPDQLSQASDLDDFS